MAADHGADTGGAASRPRRSTAHIDQGHARCGKVPNPASVAVQRERSEKWNRGSRENLLDLFNAGAAYGREHEHQNRLSAEATEPSIARYWPASAFLADAGQSERAAASVVGVRVTADPLVAIWRPRVAPVAIIAVSAVSKT